MSLIPKDEDHEADLALLARHALVGQTPRTLLALSIGVDRQGLWLRLRGHFDGPPSETDIEDIQVAGTEVIAQWVLDAWKIAVDWEVLSPGQEPRYLPGGIAFRRGDPPPAPVVPQEGPGL